MQKFNSIEEKVIFEKLTRSNLSIEENVDTIKIEDISDSFNANKIINYINEINGYIRTLESTRQNFAYRPILSYRKFIGSIIVFCKKVIRKLLKFYIEPIAFQQTEFNNAVTPTIGRMTEIQNELLKGINSLQNENIILKDQLNNNKSEIEIKIDNICNKNNKLEIELEEIKNYNNKIEMEYEEIKNCNDKLKIEFEEIKSCNDKLKFEFEEVKNYNNKLEIKHEKIKNYCNQLEESLYSRIDEILDTQNMSNKVIKRNEHKLIKLEELNLDVFKENEFNFWDKRTVAQAGEDSICAYINMALGRPLDQCTYLDLGANHAKDLSNTYLFYSHGARGVLVEANPNLIPELKFYRNGDVILNKCISTKSGDYVDFYILSGDGLSTPNLDSANEFIAKNPELKIVDTIKIETISVNDIMENYLGEAPIIMNIDIEGKDLEILESIDFEKYRPLIIIAEMIEYKPTLVIANKNKRIIEFMEENGYIEYAFTGINSIFIDKTQIKGVL